MNEDFLKQLNGAYCHIREQFGQQFEKVEHIDTGSNANSQTQITDDQSNAIQLTAIKVVKHILDLFEKSDHGSQSP